jgi:MYXO-CTERM domain-containing protein
LIASLADAPFRAVGTGTLRAVGPGMRRLPSFLASLSLLAPLVGVASIAHAETMPWDGAVWCPDPAFAPRVGRTVPANTPAFPFRLESRESDFVLRKSSFDLVPTTTEADPKVAGFQLLVPVGPLSEGAYAFHFQSTCAKSLHDFPDDSLARPFTIGASKPLPIRAGTLTLVGTARTTVREYCADSLVSAEVRANVDPSLVPFLETSMVIYEGSGLEATGAATYGGETSETRMLRLSARCADTTYAPPGKRVVRMRARVAGLPDLEEATLEVDLTCAADALVGCKEGVPPTGVDAGVDSGAGKDSGADAAGSPSDQGGSSSGCSVSTSASEPAAALFILAAVGAWLRARRARRHRG